jgi:hypothetical protein
MPANYRTPTLRSANLIAANPQRMDSVDGQRSALGRNVKVPLPDRMYTYAEVWTLKERRDGKWIVVDTQRDYAAAEAWVAGN